MPETIDCNLIIDSTGDIFGRFAYPKDKITELAWCTDDGVRYVASSIKKHSDKCWTLYLIDSDTIAPYAEETAVIDTVSKKD